MTALRFYLDWELNCQFAGPLWAREKQLYRDAGVAVQLVSPREQAGDDLLELVLADEGVGSLEENLIIKAVSAGRPVRAIAAMFKRSPLVLLTAHEGPITGLSDLPGRRVAMHKDAHQLLKALLRLSGMDANSVCVQIDGWSLDDLITGKFEAVQGYAITEAQTLARRGFEARLIPLRVDALRPHSQVLCSSLATITAQKDSLRAFLRATFEGWRAVLERPDEAADLVAAHSAEHADSMENREILSSIARYVVGDSGDSTLGILEPARWHRNLECYASCEILEREPELHTVIDLDLMPDNIRF